MKRFRNILVGVDLSDGDRYVAAQLSAATRSAVDRALWLAERSGARITFMSVVMPCLDLSEDARHLVAQQHLETVINEIEEHAREQLDALVAEAKSRGVEATIERCCGTAWYELLRVAGERNHDLVIVGSHRQHGLKQLILGSTGRKLIRKCPVPVWVTSPVEGGQVRRVLAPVDFSETCDRAVALASALSNEIGAELHLMHAVDYPFERTLHERVSVEELTEYRTKFYSDATHSFDAMLSRGLAPHVKEQNCHLVPGDAVDAIQHIVETQNIDVVVMGTLARSGLAGLFIGNTAERVMSKLTCSVLAIKPADFVCPVRFPAK
jgi:universal stress protein E